MNHDPHHHGPTHARPDASHAEVRDVVCGMTIAPENAAGTVEHEGETYYFCSPSCLEKFRADPKRYLAPKRPAPPPPASAGSEYTCPMHPEIVRSEPGSCPICGMALEPRTASLVEHNHELRSMSRRFWVSLALTIP